MNVIQQGEEKISQPDYQSYGPGEISQHTAWYTPLLNFIGTRSPPDVIALCTLVALLWLGLRTAEGGWPVFGVAALICAFGMMALYWSREHGPPSTERAQEPLNARHERESTRAA